MPVKYCIVQRDYSRNPTTYVRLREDERGIISICCALSLSLGRQRRLRFTHGESIYSHYINNSLIYCNVIARYSRRREDAADAGESSEILRDDTREYPGFSALSKYRFAC
jgi:hypothetical protein